MIGNHRILTEQFSSTSGVLLRASFENDFGACLLRPYGLNGWNDRVYQMTERTSRQGSTSSNGLNGGGDRPTTLMTKDHEKRHFQVLNCVMDAALSMKIENVARLADDEDHSQTLPMNDLRRHTTV